jgi:hypothetical protein
MMDKRKRREESLVFVIDEGERIREKLREKLEKTLETEGVWWPTGT